VQGFDGGHGEGGERKSKAWRPVGDSGNGERVRKNHFKCLATRLRFREWGRSRERTFKLSGDSLVIQGMGKE
jgi:hypothetical protein